MTRPHGQKIVQFVLLLCFATTATYAQTFARRTFHGKNGAFPAYASLVQGPDGNFYGTTSAGGSKRGGTVFEVTSTGELKTLHSFCSKDPDCADGEGPQAGLVLATDGNFYGTTATGGSHVGPNMPGGTVFKITPSGQLTTLYSFCSEPNCTDGTRPWSKLFQATDGNFYGTTSSGGVGICTPDCGTVFKMTPSGTLTTLYSFCSAFGCADGSTPLAGMVQGIDGDLYGTASSGGTRGCDDGCGTLFRITLEGKLTQIYDFSLSQGGGPVAGVVQGIDGNFYGTASGGGAGDAGTVYEITPAGELTILHSFDEYTDGVDPTGTLIQANDGNFYGTTLGGGSENGWGTAFSITPTGTLTTLHTFCLQQGCPDGTNLFGGLLQATNGAFFGTASNGGSYCHGFGCGTIFNIDIGLGPFVTFVQPFGRVGKTGGILGQGFTGTTNVSLNGVPASFTVVSDTFINATVPAGATTGYVTVATPSGTLTSNVPFHVIP
ncbi:MAG TPA: choice-of-anchor tandem repeat GloVer-containing protein [Terriglobales bacterium]|jgi:uncharacterized repeat protein (TIGR03803 family)|nr:choice-of-anchor tandem repeat GloVer-containing protein [Terriglobales bacterium]